MAMIRHAATTRRGLALSIGALLSAAPVHAADTAATLAAQADAVIVVDVAFVPYGNLVLLREVVFGDRSRVRSPVDYLGECLPGKARVRELAATDGADSALYAQAMERAAYTAVLFLRSKDGELAPLCADPASVPTHWESHPEHPQWRAAVDAALASR